MADVSWPTSNSPGLRPQEGAGRLINVFAEPRGENLGPVWHRVPGASVFTREPSVGLAQGDATASAVGFSPPVPPLPVFSGLQLWLDATRGACSNAGSLLATDGQKVQQWNDQSGNGFHASQSILGQRPIYRANIGDGLPAVEFQRASDTQLKSGGNSDFVHENFTVFIVIQRPDRTGAGTQSIVNKSDGATFAGTSWGINTSSGLENQFSTISSTLAANTIGSMKTLLCNDLICAQRVDATTKNFYRNGYLKSSGGDSGVTLNPGGAQLGIGNDAGAGLNGVNGYIREVLYYDTSLSDPNRILVEGYLRTRWGIPDLIYYSAPDDLVHSPINLRVYASQDLGETFTGALAGATNPVYTFTGPDGVTPSTKTNTCSVLKYQSNYYVAHETNVDFTDNSAQQHFCIAKAPSPVGPWTFLTAVQVWPTLTLPSRVWDPRFFIDVDGTVRITFTGNQGGTGFSNLAFYVTALDNTLANWSTKTQITGTGFPPNGSFDECEMISPVASPSGLYTMWFGDATTEIVRYATSSTFGSGYTITSPPDPLGYGSDYGNLCIYKFGNVWRGWISGVGVPYHFSESRDNWATWWPNGTLADVQNNSIAITADGNTWGTGQFGFSNPSQNMLNQP